MNAPAVNIPPSGDIQVNSYTTSDQTDPAVTALADGGWIVSWASLNQDGQTSSIYQQRYDAAGVAVGGEVLVNSSMRAEYGQNGPAIAALSDGGWVVSWSSLPVNQNASTSGLFMQRYDATGTAVGGTIQFNTNATEFGAFPQWPSIVGLEDGGWFLSWGATIQDGDNWDVFGQRFDVSGVAIGGEIQINSYITHIQQSPSLTTLRDGGWVVSWSSFGQDGDLLGVYGQRYDADGAAIGGEFQINTTTSDFQAFSSVTDLSDGGFVVSWMSGGGQDGDGFGIYQQRYNAAGVAVGGEIRVNTHVTGDQGGPSVVSLSDGGWIVTWLSFGQDGDDEGVYLQRYDAAGVAVGGEVQINGHTAGKQTNASITALADGGFVVSWQSDGGQDGDGNGIFQKVFNADGSERSGAVYLENAAAVAVAPGLAVTDIDSTSLVGATATISDYVAGEDVLSFADQDGITGFWDATTGTLTLTGMATLAAYETALRSVTYANSSDAPTGTGRNIAFQVDDGGTTDNLSTPVNAEVSIVPVADPGEIVGVSGVNDTLNATAGHDMFIFKPGFGEDTVIGFQPGAGTDDIIQLESMGYTDLAGVLADTQQMGTDTVITVDAENSITLVGVNMANLHDDDFQFVV